MLNKVSLIGRLGKDPEGKQGQNKYAVRFSLACGEKDYVQWINVVAYDKLAQVLIKYLQKGTLIYLEGAIQNVQYKDQQGVDKSFTQIVTGQVKFLTGTKQDNQQQNSSQGPGEFDPSNF